MAIRAIAIAAPEHVAGHKDTVALNSTDPASLFNALRSAAAAAASGQGSWSNSNWAGSCSRRRESCLLMYSLDDLPLLEALLHTERPNLVLIGAMSICMRGAVECARHVREVIGDDCLIVLGGRHSTETVYRSKNGNSVAHHAASPLRLMSLGRIPDVFDLVVGGEGEDIIHRLGQALDRQPFQGRHDRARILRELSGANGEWAAGVLDPGGKVITALSAGKPVERNSMPSASRLFGVSSRFDVFNGAYTAHVFSDTGQGCVFDCNFCSERRSVVGKPQDVGYAATRLYRQMREAVEVIEAQYGPTKSSAFVEDSVLLMGKKSAIADFCTLMEDRPLPLKFGAQLTIDQILARPAELRRLASVGLRYLFVGIETLEPNAIGGMSKDISRAGSAWDVRIKAAFELLASLNISVGAALLFGLGESTASRINLFHFLEQLRVAYNAPQPISMNWAVQHPLKGFDRGANYEYIEWPVVGEDMLRLFHAFGEASTEYPLPYVARASYNEVLEVVSACKALSAPLQFLDHRTEEAVQC